MRPGNKISIQPYKTISTGMLFKLFVSGGLLVWLVTRIDILKVGGIIQGLQKKLLVVVIGLLWVTIGLVAKRWQLVIQLDNKVPSFGQFHAVPLKKLLKATFIGAFFNQFLPSSVGGDFYRILAVRRFGASLSKAVSGVILDRVWGFVSLGILCTIAIPAEGELLLSSDLKWPFVLTMVLFASVCAGGLILMVLPRSVYKYAFWRPVLPFVEMICEMKHQPGLFMRLLIISVGASIALILGLLVLMMAFQVPLTWGQGAAILPVVMLLASLPISFAGWGLREGAMVLALGIYGIAPEKALAISLVYGILQMLSGLPGLVLWFVQKGKEIQTCSGKPEIKE